MCLFCHSHSTSSRKRSRKRRRLVEESKSNKEMSKKDESKESKEIGTFHKRKKHSQSTKHVRSQWTVDGESFNIDGCFTVSAQCKICGQTFDDLPLYQEHVRDTHYTPGNWGRCSDMSQPECALKSGGKRQGHHFFAHLSRVHQWKKPLRCTQCAHTAATKRYMLSHWEDCHGLQRTCRK